MFPNILFIHFFVFKLHDRDNVSDFPKVLSQLQFLERLSNSKLNIFSNIDGKPTKWYIVIMSLLTYQCAFITFRIAVYSLSYKHIHSIITGTGYTSAVPPDEL